jgi:hypothetical protein
MRTPLLALATLLMLAGSVRADDFSVSGRVIDSQGYPIPQANIQLVQSHVIVRQLQTDVNGQFAFDLSSPGECVIKVDVEGFEEVTTDFAVMAGLPSFNLRVDKLKTRNESITVTADADDTSLTDPDPGQRVMVRNEMLDANPGRPGAPVSIPGLPIETASGGIKAPQYFAPGVAGDHGEPIAQYVLVGTYRLPNNLSANAHGNGYADPNVLIPQVIDSVQVDGGAFNVLEGNHALNLGAAYGLRQKIEPFITMTGDDRDVDVVGGLSPEGRSVPYWLEFEVAFGNGSLDRLEHRKQYKVNASRVFDFGSHELTLFGVGYFGTSHIPGLTPLGVPGLHDTIDPRQKDQTHTAALAANDVWNLGSEQQFDLSGFFRSYNLALFSNFGDGLIRQSEFRTVTGGNITYSNHWDKYISILAGADYARDAPRRLDLDHYDSNDPSLYGPFHEVTSNNVTLNDVAPFIAMNGSLGKFFHYYAGLRHDEINFDNVDLLVPSNSFVHLVGVDSPKATLTYAPPASSWLPTTSFSFGEAFFTNDPRIGVGTVEGTLVETSHSYQLVVDKTADATDFRMIFGHVSTTASFAKIDPDTGLQENEGPGRLNFLTLTVRHRFNVGMLQASISKADAHDRLTGEPTPEAPRTIFTVLGTVDRLPLRLQARGEFEFVGQKPLGDGFVSVPVRELRGAVVRRFLNQRMEASMNLLIASGYTGQTTETLALPGDPNPFERIVGVRIPSSISGSVSYRF